jgi:very-short-patch-repair endonuclease
MSVLPYNQNLKERARELRKNSTLGEVLLWNELRGRKVGELRFLRQKPIENYIVDFYCTELKLVIEIDGSSHNLKVEEDKFRQDQLESFGITFLRFTEEEVRKNMESVLREIKQKTSSLQK